MAPLPSSRSMRYRPASVGSSGCGRSITALPILVALRHDGARSAPVQDALHEDRGDNSATQSCESAACGWPKATRFYKLVMPICVCRLPHWTVDLTRGHVG